MCHLYLSADMHARMVWRKQLPIQTWYNVVLSYRRSFRSSRYVIQCCAPHVPWVAEVWLTSSKTICVPQRERGSLDSVQRTVTDVQLSLHMDYIVAVSTFVTFTGYVRTQSLNCSITDTIYCVVYLYSAGIVYSVSGCTRGVQVKLWDPLRTHAIPERLRGVITTRRYTNPLLPLAYLYLLLPRCIECKRGLAMRILSVCPSVRLSNECDKTEQRYV